MKSWSINLKERKETVKDNAVVEPSKKKGKTPKKVDKTPSKQSSKQKKHGRKEVTKTTFTEEEGTLMSMAVTEEEENEIFPATQDAQNNSFESDSGEEDMDVDDDNANLNANQLTAEPDALKIQEHQNVQGRNHGHNVAIPETRQTCPVINNNGQSGGLMQSITVMQKLMLKQGLIAKPFDDKELKELLQEEEADGGNTESPNCLNVSNTREALMGNQNQQIQRKSIIPNPMTTGLNRLQGKNPVSNESDLAKHCESEVTIYKRAVKQVAPDLDVQIEHYINNLRKESGDKNKSNSLEEFMDTSDECETALISLDCVSDLVAGESKDP